MSLESELDEILKKLEYWETMEPVNNMGKMSQKTALESLNKKKLKLEKKLGILQKNQYIVEQLKLKNNMENTLRVKYSTFQTKLSFNEWAQHFQVSTLSPQLFEPYNKKLDNFNEVEKRKMITSVYEMEINE